MTTSARRWLPRITLGAATGYLVAIVALDAPEASLDALLAGRAGFGLTFAAWIGLQLGALAVRARAGSVALAALRAHPDRAALLAIGLLAAAIRLTAVSAEATLEPGVDEARYVAEALRMIEHGTLDHQNLEHGGLPYFAQALASMAYGVVGPMQGLGGSLAELPREGHLRYGRGLMAILGALNVVALGWAVRPLARGAAAPLLAALFLALDAAHVADGIEIHDDLHAALWVTLAWGTLARLPARRGRFTDLAAGGVAGLAVAAKYYDLVIALPLALVVLGDARRRGEPAAPRLGAAAAGLALGFFVGSPFTVLHPGHFLAQTHDLHLNTVTSAPGAALAPHLVRSVTTGLGPVLAAVLALACVARGAAPTARTWVTAAFPVALLVLLASFDRIYARYLLPLHPYLCWGTAAALVEAAQLARERLAPRRARGVAVGVALVAGAGIAAAAPGLVEVLHARFRVSSAEEAGRWMAANLGRGSRVLSEMPLSGALGERGVEVAELAVLGSLTVQDVRAAGFDFVLVHQQNFGRRGLRRAYARLVRELALVKVFHGGAGPAEASERAAEREGGGQTRLYAVRAFPVRAQARPVAGGWRVSPGALPPGRYAVRVAPVEAGRAIEVEVARTGAPALPPLAGQAVAGEPEVRRVAFDLDELATVELVVRGARDEGAGSGGLDLTLERRPDPDDPIFQPRRRRPAPP